MNVVLIIYILFAVINIIICSILAYTDYNNGEAITLGNICTIFSMTIISICGTIWIALLLLDRYNEIIILQKKKIK